ncbi:MAG: hypothetical protein SPI62_02740 [Candidatus Enteromonas sp.]|nr:hypothetical protein [bacterium]MDD6917446.1 hypothetical protein [bacterium]MDY6100768.1 hypothetical protein [Candidatus Enteromonas sp.]
MKDDPIRFAEERENFALFVSELIQQEVSLFFPLKKDYPVDDQLLLSSSFFSFILFDAFHQVKPTLSEVGLFLEGKKDIGDLYQTALYWYQVWNESDFNGSLQSFCCKINEIVQKKARSKTDAPWILLPDFRGRKRTLFRKLSGDPFLDGTKCKGGIPVL